MFGGMEHAFVKAAWIVAAPFWCIAVGAAAIAWILWNQGRGNGRR